MSYRTPKQNLPWSFQDFGVSRECDVGRLSRAMLAAQAALPKAKRYPVACMNISHTPDLRSVSSVGLVQPDRRLFASVKTFVAWTRKAKRRYVQLSLRNTTCSEGHFMFLVIEHGTGWLLDSEYDPKHYTLTRDACHLAGIPFGGDLFDKIRAKRRKALQVGHSCALWTAMMYTAAANHHDDTFWAYMKERVEMSAARREATLVDFVQLLTVPKCIPDDHPQVSWMSSQPLCDD